MTMKTHTNRHNIIHPAKCLLLLMGLCTLLFACQQDDFNYVSGEEAEDETAVLTYNVSLNGEAQTRAIGDGQSVDQLLVGVFLDGNFIKTHTFKNRNTEGQFTVSIPLLRKEEYTLVFWAQNKNNGIYTISEGDMQISIDYSKYDGKSLKATETFEVFSAVKTGVTVSSALTDGGTLSLTRPFAQVNVAAAEADILDKVKRAELTLTNLPTGYNPLTGTMEGSEDKTFTFTNFSVEENDNLTTDDASYRYLATVWALPTTTAITVNLYDAEEGGNTVRDEMTFTGIELKPNVRLNIVGNMIQQQTMAAWDGVTFSNPADKTPDQIQCPMVEQITRAETTDEKILHIETPDELAYILKEGIPTGYTGIHICQNLDMGGHDWNKLENIGSIEPFGLPAGTLISALSVEGEHFTVSNIIMDGNNATGLFGDVENLTVKDITFSGITITNGQEDGGVGIVAGTAYGNLSMSNVSVEGGSLQASSGKAGGLVGKILRISEKDRTETLQADFNHCTINATAINGAVAGKFVGEFSGYDYKEKLNFNGCSTSGVTGIATTDFCNDRKSCFIETSPTEDHFLGQETYCRGTVNFDGNRFVPKWDGVRSDIVPLVENSVNVIYSPYDVAYYQKKSPTTVTFKANVDLGSHKFNPIYSIKTLDGENHTVYNLKVDMVHDGTGAAFIQTAYGTTNHRNITLVGADIKNVHNTSIPTPAYGVTNDGGAGNAYAGTFVSHTGGTYTIDNVHVKSGKVYAVCKMGGLVGYVGGNLTMTNCSVEDYTVENYAPGVPNYYTLPTPGYMDMYLQQFQENTATNVALAFIGIHKIPEYGRVNLLQWWYTQGEAGGLIGFLKSPKAVIDGCSVKNSNIRCEGQPDKSVVANVWDTKDFDTNNPYQSGKPIFAKGTTDIAGRHVNQFIGDVVSARSSESGTDYDVTISNYTVSGNRYFDVDANNTNTYSHDYASGKYCEVVGCAYYVGVDVGLASVTLKHVNDYAGKLTFYKVGEEAEKVVLEEAAGSGNNQTWTGGSFSDMKYTQGRDKIGGSWYNPTYGPWYYKTLSEYPAAP